MLGGNVNEIALSQVRRFCLGAGDLGDPATITIGILPDL